MIKLEFTVEQLNSLVNILNTPYQVPTVVLANFINLIQSQAEPQIAAMPPKEPQDGE